MFDVFASGQPSTPESIRECTFFYLGKNQTYRFYPSTLARLRKAVDVQSTWLQEYRKRDMKMTIPNQGEFEVSDAILDDVTKIWALCADSNESTVTVEYFLCMAFVHEPAFCKLLAFVNELVNEQIIKNAVSLQPGSENTP